MFSTMKKRVLGFTLIELMVVISIVAILAFVAIPSFQGAIRRNAVESQQLDLLTALNQARQEAVTRNTKISICRSTDATTCAGNGDWTSGWIVFINSAAAGTVANVTDILAKHGALKQSVSVRLLDSTSTPKAFMQFNANGFLSSTSAAQSGTFILCSSDKNLKNARGILVNATGRATQSPMNTSGSYIDINDVALTCP